MSGSWEKATAEEVRVGDRVRLASGKELQVTEIQSPFLGRKAMLAFIEETDSTWFKQPAQRVAEVEVLRPK